MILTIRRLVRNTSGATAIEYGLIAALVSIAAIAAMSAMGTSLDGMFTNVATRLTCAVGGTPGEGQTCPTT
ncbi:MAG TPA: Flp family type IVb pilin [Azospirillaceae bacterium]|nr:Flp family type IVb pilin [Azospirillaceae bacterium]